MPGPIPRPTPGFLIYRCRSCRAEWRGPVPDLCATAADGALLSRPIVLGGPGTDGGFHLAPEVAMHECPVAELGVRRYGMADLVAAEIPEAGDGADGPADVPTAPI